MAIGWKFWINRKKPKIVIRHRERINYWHRCQCECRCNNPCHWKDGLCIDCWKGKHQRVINDNGVNKKD